MTPTAETRKLMLPQYRISWWQTGLLVVIGLVGSYSTYQLIASLFALA